MVEGYGTFIHKGSHTYRMSAYLQWGKSSKPIGLVLMLNPGSASLTEVINREVNNEFGRLAIDPTMKALDKLVQMMNEGKSVEGRLYIYNLFPLRNSANNDAVKCLEELWHQESLVTELPEERTKLVDFLKECHWILLGWGCHDKSKNLNQLKTKWLSVIEEAGIPILGKKCGNGVDYNHPLPRLHIKVIEYREEILAQYVKLIKDPKNKVIDDDSSKNGKLTVSLNGKI